MKNKLIRTALSSGGYITVNKYLAKMLSLHASLITGTLVWEQEKAEENDALDPDGYFLVYRPAIEDQTTLSPKQQRNAEKLLLAHKFIKMKTNREKNALLYKLNEAEIQKFMEKGA